VNARVAWLLPLLVALACGPIEAPPPVVDLTTHPDAFQAAFDGALGVPRLVLLLSPA
jgi:hypothetical protein